MQSITLHNALPVVFRNEGGRQSNIWLRDVVLRKGDRILVEAESGTGKSSLASFIYGQRKDYDGEILFDQTDIRTINSAGWDDIHRCHISLLFQELRLFPELTAMENVLLKNRLTAYKTERQILDLFDFLGISNRVHTLVAHMSYGQQQRVALIRALCQPFDFLIADEPISHIDDVNAAKMAELVAREAEERGAAVIVTSIGKHFDIGYTKTMKL